MPSNMNSYYAYIQINIFNYTPVHFCECFLQYHCDKICPQTDRNINLRNYFRNIFCHDDTETKGENKAAFMLKTRLGREGLMVKSEPLLSQCVSPVLFLPRQLKMLDKHLNKDQNQAQRSLISEMFGRALY